MTKINFYRDDELKEFIGFNYFDNDLKGKKRDKDYKLIEVNDEDTWLKTILKGLDGEDIKLSNRGILSGYLKLKVVESGGKFYLKPHSEYCIITEDNLYSFY